MSGSIESSFGAVWLRLSMRLAASFRASLIACRFSPKAWAKLSTFSTIRVTRCGSTARTKTPAPLPASSLETLSIMLIP